MSEPMTSIEFAERLQDPGFRRRAMRAGYIQGVTTDVAEIVAAMEADERGEPS